MSIESIEHREDLQGLRGLAITLVVLSHAGAPGFAGGFVGVDVFFVLSGYLISGILFREYVASGRIQILRFIARRLRRLLPALLTMLISVMFLGAVLLSTHEFKEQTESVAYAATWTSNLYFAFTKFEYFNELHLRDLFLHTWSLGVEEQFYLIWPFICLGLFSFAGTRPNLEKFHRSMLIGLAALFLASLMLSLHWTANASTLAFYLMPSRIWQFALGAMVFLWFDPAFRSSSEKRALPIAWGRRLRVLGVFLIVGSAAFFDPQMAYPGAWATLPSIGAALLIARRPSDEDSGARNFLIHPLAVWVGNRSYSWYLWHWPVLMLGFAWGLEMLPMSVGALVALSLMLAAVTYRWIELPIWKGRFSSTPPKLAIVASLFGILVTATALGELNERYRDGTASGLALSRAVRLDMPDPYRMQGCDTWFHDARLQPCVFGKANSKRTAVLIGDSIGTQWFSFLPEIYSDDVWQIVVLTKSSCAIVDESYHYGPVGEYKVCAEWRSRAIQYLTEISPDVVFIGSAATYGFSESQWKGGISRVLDRVTPNADRVILIPGTPSLSFDGPSCLERWWSKRPAERSAPEDACREPIKNRLAERIAKYVEEVVVAYENADVLNLNDLVCPAGYCAAREPSGVVVFRDQQHLTDSFVRANVSAIQQRLVQIGVRAATAN